MAGLHLHPDVQTLLDFEERYVRVDGATVAEELEVRVRALRRAMADGHRAGAVLEANFPCEQADPDAWAREMVRREHGFDAEPIAPTLRHDPRFAAALALTLHGRVGALRALLRREPDLVRARSAYGHRATLLHYLAANGVEIRHQVVHERAPKVAVVLLEAGAEVDAPMRAYGGEHRTLSLLLSSAHPRAAGVAEDLAHVLRAGGAAP